MHSVVWASRHHIISVDNYCDCDFCVYSHGTVVNLSGSRNTTEDERTSRSSIIYCVTLKYLPKNACLYSLLFCSVQSKFSQLVVSETSESLTTPRGTKKCKFICADYGSHI